MTEAILLELQAGEGGEDAKLLVNDQLSIYIKAASKHGL